MEGGIIQHTSNVRGKGGRGGLFSTRVMYEGRMEGGGGGDYSAHE